jgi:hypothetical protein
MKVKNFLPYWEEKKNRNSHQQEWNTGHDSDPRDPTGNKEW